MTPINTTLQAETARLDQLRASQLVGICYLDVDGRLVQFFDTDPGLRAAILDFQADRVSSLTATEHHIDSLENGPGQARHIIYPVSGD